MYIWNTVQLMEITDPIVKISPQMGEFEKAPLNRCIAATRINTGCFW
jgi:hypothetical protein